MAGGTGFNFVPNTKIRSTEVNQNFEWTRGHYLPITQSGTWANTTGVYDLGSATYKFRDGYFSGSVSAAAMTATAIGGILNGGPEKLRFVRGVADTDASILIGSGFSVVRSATGTYLVSMSTNFTGTISAHLSILNPNAVSLSGLTAASAFFNSVLLSTTSFQIQTRGLSGAGGSSAAVDVKFAFLASGVP